MFPFLLSAEKYVTKCCAKNYMKYLEMLDSYVIVCIIIFILYIYGMAVIESWIE